MKASEYFTLPPSLALFARHFDADALPWEWLKHIGAAVAGLPAARSGVATNAAELSSALPGSVALPPGVHVEGQVWLHPSVKVPAYATLIGPAWIGARTEIRPGAFIRGNVIVGEGCVLGNACEFKNCLLLDSVQVPHFSYVGDSILGNKAHLGAGVICSNLRLDQKPVIVRVGDKTYETGLRKFGALVGDAAEVGCNAVLNPGSILGRRGLVSPTTSFSGCLPAATIAYSRPQLKMLPRKD